MRQTILSVVLDVEPQSAARLAGLIEQFKRDQEPAGAPEWYSALKQGVPALHFMSMSVFENSQFDPIFVIEANFDGPPGPFWAQMEAAFGAQLRPMLRCCKRPADDDGPVYDAVTKPFSRYPLAPYLEKRTLRPSVFHQGNRGLERDRVLCEGELFLATREALAQPSPTEPNPYRGIAAQEVHRKLRVQLLGRFPWLAAAAAPRISWAERAGDLARLLGFVFLVLFCLSIPGMALAPVTLAWRFVVLTALLAGLVAFGLWRMRAPLAGEGVPTRSGGLTVARMPARNKVILIAAVAAVLALYILVATALGSLLVAPMTDLGFEQVLCPTARVVVLGLLSVAFTGPALVLWLRWLERRDSSQDAPPVDLRLLGEMARREDWIPQNHMGSVVLVKPGVLRMALFRTGHLGLGLVLRVVAIDGYLGSMRTVHFAHWAFVNNGSRLMFFSNFDHSWESYLDDFIEKAHGGLTLAWGSGIGFPPARFLVLDGASHGRKFKDWARHSMAVSRFWYSAYRDFTVDQIERNVRIADGLRKETLSEQEAAAWALDL
jgi:membrane protein implicated in regulation of membrane protease activity